MINIAFIGTVGVAERHADGLRDIPKARLADVWSRKEKIALAPIIHATRYCLAPFLQAPGHEAPHTVRLPARRLHHLMN